MSLRSKLVFPPRLPEQVLELLRQKHCSPDAILRISGHSPLGRVLAAVMINGDETNDYRVPAIEAAGKDAAQNLHRSLTALATLAVVDPLMVRSQSPRLNSSHQCPTR